MASKATTKSEVVSVKWSDPPTDANGPQLPAPTVKAPLPPYTEDEPHPLPADRLNLSVVEQVIAPVAAPWKHPGVLEIDSFGISRQIFR